VGFRDTRRSKYFFTKKINMMNTEYNRWVQDNGELKRLNYDLNENSTIFDIGGFHGDWTNKIYNKYKSNIYIFEPVKSCVKIITNKFNKNDKIKIFEYGLGDETKNTMISLDGDAASIYNKSNNMENIHLVNISDFLTINSIENIDLMKINIEGGEYGLLKKIIDDGHVRKIKNFQIQFHDFIPNAKQMRADLQSKLNISHKVTYNYNFIWENWEIK